eukprot:3809296-Amphidinium_carterae.1
MAYDVPAGDLQGTADLNTIRICQRRLDAGQLEWPLQERLRHGFKTGFGPPLFVDVAGDPYAICGSWLMYWDGFPNLEAGVVVTSTSADHRVK